MKKQFLLSLFAITLMGNFVNAQSKTDDIFKKYRFGLFLGPTFNSMKPIASTSDNYALTKGKTNVGFTFGIMADYNIDERYSVFTGLGLDWRGGGINAQLPSTVMAEANYVRGANVKYRLQYLTIPIGLKMTAARFDKIKIQAIAGFDLGLLLSQKGNYTYTTSTWDSVKNNYTTLPEVQNAKLGGLATAVPFTLGWSIGIGGEYDLNGKNAVIAQLIYRNGFVDVTTPKTNDDGAKFSDGNVRSNSIALKIGYTF